VSAVAELRAGRAGPAFARELQRTVRAVAVARNFPPPDGHAAWDADAVHAVAAEFLTDAQTPRRLADLALHCASDEALRARLQGAVRNFLADLGRRTPIGKLVVRINEVLRTEPGFRREGGRWASASAGAAGPAGAAGAAGAAEPGPGSEDPDLLARAVAGHPVTVPPWGHEARRSAPVADRDTIVALCAALLDAAGGSLTPRAMARAVGHRLGLGQAPLSLEVAALDGPQGLDTATDATAAAADSTGTAATRTARAAEVLAGLADPERLAVAYPELGVRQLGPLLGVSPSQAHVIRTRAAGIIRTELLDDDDAEGVAVRVMEVARMWADDMDDRSRSAVLSAR
jgi:hypothetical protein